MAWQLIDTAPKDGRIVILGAKREPDKWRPAHTMDVAAAYWEVGERSVWDYDEADKIRDPEWPVLQVKRGAKMKIQRVIDTSSWALTDVPQGAIDNGIGFEPTHWMDVPELP